MNDLAAQVYHLAEHSIPGKQSAFCCKLLNDDEGGDLRNFKP